MSGNNLALDTNIILYLLGGDATLTYFLEGKQGFLSVITELELIGYPSVQASELKSIQGFLQTCTVIPIIDEIKSIYTHLRQQYKLKLGDAAAAATAIYLELPFISADKGFSKVAELNFMLYTP